MCGGCVARAVMAIACSAADVLWLEVSIMCAPLLDLTASSFQGGRRGNKDSKPTAINFIDNCAIMMAHHGMVTCHTVTTWVQGSLDLAAGSAWYRHSRVQQSCTAANSHD